MKKHASKRHLLASVGLVSLMAASSASAADMAPLLKAPPAPVWSWSGLYLGAHGGYGWGHDPFTDTIFAGKAPLLGINSKGGVWGFHAGANWQEGALVGGLELDFSGTSIKGSSSVTSTLTVGPDSATTSVTQTDKFDYLGSARARVGYLVTPNVLLYGTGGLAWTRLVQTQFENISINVVTPPAFTATIAAVNSTPSWRFGFAVGAGIEARLWDTNWLGRVEYLHYDFGDSGSFASTFGGTPGSSFASGRLTADVVRAGLSYKFDRDRFAAAVGYPAAGGYPAMPVKAPRAAPVPWSWSGFYIGAHAGYGWGRDPFTDPIATGLVLTDINSNGFVGGFQAGGNWQWGAWVGGLEIDLSGTDVKKTNTGTVVFPGGDTETHSRTDKFDLLGSARTRIGFLPWPNLLVYGTGGLAWTRLVQTDVDTAVFGGTPSSNTNATPTWRFGWVAGVGVESRLWETNWLARLEYLHYDFGDSGSSFNGDGTGTTSSNLTVDVIRAGLSYKFGQDLFPAAGPTVMPVKAPRAVATAWTWSGYYLGGHAGYGWGRDPQSDAVFGGKITQFPLLGDINSQGFVAGFQAGGNWQMGAWVAGLETDLSGTGIKGSTTGPFNDGTGTVTLTDKFKMLGSARARLGYLVPLPWQSVLFYGTGGLAWTRLEQDSVTNFVGGGVSGFTTPFWKFGWVAGVGGETRLWDSNWLLRLEYLHYDFGDSGNFAETVITANTVPPINASLSQTTGHLTANVVRTGLSFKLD
jgi:opacity protein-like surface antigen